MCGIVGYKNLLVNSEVLLKATEKLNHRGPDHQNIFINSTHKVGMGHTRLSILDLNPRSNQPMHSMCGRYTIVFNGEIYNYRELAEKYCLALKTHSDTEVILELFALKGPAMIKECNGMFALVIFDSETDAVYLFRDRLGIKPLFFYNKGNHLVFASELKAVLPFLDSFEINQSAIFDFLQLGYIPHPYTWYKDVRKFPQACYGEFKGGNLSIMPYWQVEPNLPSFISEGNTLSQLDSLLNSAVKYRMIADVPVGAFLSGGIDSSIVVAYAKEFSEKRLKTFTIGFKDSKFDERSYAANVARYLGTEHYEYLFSERELLERVDLILDIFDEPFADTSCLPTLMVSEFAKKEVKVALSGDGGDEQFLGYGAYSWADRFGNSMFYNSRKMFSKGLQLLGGSRNLRVSGLLDMPDRESFHQHIFSQEHYFFSAAELSDLLVSKNPNAPIFSSYDFSATGQAYFDLLYYLPDDLLVKVDRASMFHALEVRVPLLDYRIVEFTSRLPKSMKRHGNISKYLLKQLLHKKLPKKLFDRPKWGFGVPLGSWLKADLKYLVDHYLGLMAVEDMGIFEPHQVRLLVNKFYSGQDYLYNRIWAMILVQKAMKQLPSKKSQLY